MTKISFGLRLGLGLASVLSAWAQVPTGGVWPLEAAGREPQVLFLVREAGTPVGRMIIDELNESGAVRPDAAPAARAQPACRVGEARPLSDWLGARPPAPFARNPFKLVFLPLIRAEDGSETKALGEFLADYGWSERLAAWSAAGVATEVFAAGRAAPAPKDAAGFGRALREAALPSGTSLDLSATLAAAVEHYGRENRDGSFLRALPVFIVLWAEAPAKVAVVPRLAAAPANYPLGAQALVLNIVHGVAVGPGALLSGRGAVEKWAAANGVAYSAVRIDPQTVIRDHAGHWAQAWAGLVRRLAPYQTIALESALIDRDDPRRVFVFQAGQTAPIKLEMPLTPGAQAVGQARLLAGLVELLKAADNTPTPYRDAMGKFRPHLAPASWPKFTAAVFDDLASGRLRGLFAAGLEGDARAVVEDCARNFPGEAKRVAQLRVLLDELTEAEARAALDRQDHAAALKRASAVVDPAREAALTAEIRQAWGLARLDDDFAAGEADLEAGGWARSPARLQAAAEAVLREANPATAPAREEVFRKWLGRLLKGASQLTPAARAALAHWLVAAPDIDALLERVTAAGGPANGRAILTGQYAAAAVERLAWLEFSQGNLTPWREWAARRFAATEGKGQDEAYRLYVALAQAGAAQSFGRHFAALHRLAPGETEKALAALKRIPAQAAWNGRVRAEVLPATEVPIGVVASRAETRGKDARVTWVVWTPLGDGRGLRLEFDGAMPAEAAQLKSRLAAAPAGGRARALEQLRFADAATALLAALGLWADAHRTAPALREPDALARPLLDELARERWVDYAFFWDARAPSRGPAGTPPGAVGWRFTDLLPKTEVERAQFNQAPAAFIIAGQPAADGSRRVDLGQPLAATEYSNQQRREVTSQLGVLRVGLRFKP
jgi:hypothetical protein